MPATVNKQLSRISGSNASVQKIALLLTLFLSLPITAALSLSLSLSLSSLSFSHYFLKFQLPMTKRL